MDTLYGRSGVVFRRGCCGHRRESSEWRGWGTNCRVLVEGEELDIFYDGKLVGAQITQLQVP